MDGLPVAGKILPDNEVFGIPTTTVCGAVRRRQIDLFRRAKRDAPEPVGDSIDKCELQVPVPPFGSTVPALARSMVIPVTIFPYALILETS